MASNIYMTILNRKIENFIRTFSNDSNKIFKKDSNDLIHPGEYGKYREDACKEILRLVLKNEVDISDGFIITSKNRVSTQCDIIIYNSNTVPLISDGIARMFPIEEVKAIGEVKSNLNKKNFQEALQKMAKNKEMQNERSHTIIKKKYNSQQYDTLPTFLICNKLEFNYEDIDLNTIYGDIPREYWHNAILSIEDGFISYVADYRQGNENTIKILKENGFIIEEKGIWPYPYVSFRDDIFETRENIVYINQNDKYHHIIDFFVNVSNLVDDVHTYQHDLVEYLGLKNKPFFIEN